MDKYIIQSMLIKSLEKEISRLEIILYSPDNLTKKERWEINKQINAYTHDLSEMLDY